MTIAVSPAIRAPLIVSSAQFSQDPLEDNVFLSVDSVQMEFTGAAAYDLGFHEFGTTNAIPEPSTFALLGMGCVGLFLYQRRRKLAQRDSQQ